MSYRRFIVIVLVLGALAFALAVVNAKAQSWHRVHRSRPDVVTCDKDCHPSQRGLAIYVRHYGWDNLPDPVAYMVKLAPEFWGQQACPTRGWTVQFSSPPSAFYDFAFGWAQVGDQQASSCVITMNTQWFWSTQNIYNWWSYFCASFLHEYGHMLGHEHGTDPARIMYPTISSNVPPRCNHNPTGNLVALPPGVTNGSDLP